MIKTLVALIFFAATSMAGAQDFDCTRVDQAGGVFDLHCAPKIPSPPPNQAPVANAGPDQAVVAGAVVQLDGSGSSDPEGSPLSYAWTISGSGPPVQISDPSIVNPTFAASAAGTYVVELVVSDGALTSPADSAIITVNSPPPPPNLPPVASAGADQNVFKGIVVQLDGSASADPEGVPLAYSWSLVSPGPPAQLSDPSASNPTFLASSVGDYVATLIVNDGVQDSAPDSVVIHVANLPPPPPPSDDIEGFGQTMGGQGGPTILLKPGDTHMNLAQALNQNGPRIITCEAGVVFSIQMTAKIPVGGPKSFLTWDMRPCQFTLIKPPDQRPLGVDGIVFNQGFHDGIIMGIRGIGSSYEPGTLLHLNNSGVISFDGDTSSDPTLKVHHIYLAYNWFKLGADSNPDLYGNVEDITIEYNVFSDNMHPMTWSAANLQDKRRRITFRGNVMIRNFERTPQLKNDIEDVDLVNNVWYAWGGFPGGAYPNFQGAYAVRFQDDGGNSTNPQRILTRHNAWVAGASKNPEDDCIFGDTSNPDGGGAGSARLIGPLQFVDNIFTPDHKAWECKDRLQPGDTHFVPPYTLKVVLPANALEPIFDQAGPPLLLSEEQALLDEAKAAYQAAK